MKNQLILILVFLTSNIAYALDLNSCGRKTGSGYAVNLSNGSERVQAVTLETAQQIFQELKKPEYKIPYMSASNHCDKRA